MLFKKSVIAMICVQRGMSLNCELIAPSQLEAFYIASFELIIIFNIVFLNDTHIPNHSFLYFCIVEVQTNACHDSEEGV